MQSECAHERIDCVWPAPPVERPDLTPQSVRLGNSSPLVLAVCCSRCGLALHVAAEALAPTLQFSLSRSAT